MRYQGVDWRNSTFWGCNGGVSPDGPNQLDGGNWEVLEGLFVPLHDHLLHQRWVPAMTAKRYSAWQRACTAVRPSPLARCTCTSLEGHSRWRQ